MNTNNSDGETRQFTGIWIPRAIVEHPDLNWTERGLLAEIDSLTGEVGCFASREFLAMRMGLSVIRVKDILTKFRKMGLIVDLYFDGRKQYIATSWSAVCMKFHKKGPKNGGGEKDGSSPENGTADAKQDGRGLENKMSGVLKTRRLIQAKKPEGDNREKEEYTFKKKQKESLRESESLREPRNSNLTAFQNFLDKKEARKKIKEWKRGKPMGWVPPKDLTEPLEELEELEEIGKPAVKLTEMEEYDLFMGIAHKESARVRRLFEGNKNGRY
jgi:hypothetical protein